MRIKLILSILLILITIGSIFSQDLILKKSKEEIKSKILEVSSKSIKYKRFENLDGPTYTILTDDLLLVRYQNGSFEYFDKNYYPVDEKSNQINAQVPIELSSNTKYEKTADRSNQVEITEKFKFNAKNLDGKSDQIPFSTISEIIHQKELKIENQNLVDALEYESNNYMDDSLKKLSKNNVILKAHKKEFLIPNNFNKKKKFWIYSALSFSAIGLFSIFQSNNLYDNYKNANSNANSIRTSIQTYNTIIPIAFGLSGFCGIEFLLNSKKAKPLKVSVTTNNSYFNLGFKIQI